MDGRRRGGSRRGEIFVIDGPADLLSGLRFGLVFRGELDRNVEWRRLIFGFLPDRGTFLLVIVGIRNGLLELLSGLIAVGGLNDDERLRVDLLFGDDRFFELFRLRERLARFRERDRTRFILSREWLRLVRLRYGDRDLRFLRDFSKSELLLECLFLPRETLRLRRLFLTPKGLGLFRFREKDLDRRPLQILSKLELLPERLVLPREELRLFRLREQDLEGCLLRNFSEMLLELLFLSREEL